jgi:hypothetical protein
MPRVTVCLCAVAAAPDPGVELTLPAGHAILARLPPAPGFGGHFCAFRCALAVRAFPHALPVKFQCDF